MSGLLINERPVDEQQFEVIAALVAQTPELDQSFDVTEAHLRLQHDGLLLTAELDGAAVGFKIGYNRFKDGSYYSWLGAVLPEFRGHDVAQQLLVYQEQWVKARGYTGIYVKTRNRFVGMRILLAKNSYHQVGLESQPDSAEHRLLHYKALA